MITVTKEKTNKGKTKTKQTERTANTNYKNVNNQFFKRLKKAKYFLCFK